MEVFVGDLTKIGVEPGFPSAPLGVRDERMDQDYWRNANRLYIYSSFSSVILRSKNLG
ncbi:hypothetical protein [Sphingobacterium sp. BS-2]|uniref:hypothetical protein n=1 Tax=Sphingobacterium sp. BS-2 TaxID=3377129 RepID=UPI0038FD0641